MTPRPIIFSTISTLLLLSLVIVRGLYAAQPSTSNVVVGAERTDMVVDKLENKRVGLIVNQTSVVGKSQVHLLDTLLSRGVNVTTIFTPEHGFRGSADAGELVADGRDVKSGLPIVSLYGSNRRPTKEQLEGLDVVVFDIQDVGVRFYTYISTLFYVMQSCAENNISVVVLDRPNPNDYVDGPIMQDAQKSFVGALSIPILHGLTVGELAKMIVGEGWIENNKLDLSVIPMKGWRHGDYYDLPIKPSPNLPNSKAIALYPSLCLFEATDISVGRGTLTPFQIIGYPDPKFGEFVFTPRPLVGFDKNPMHNGKSCYGIDLRKANTTGGFTLSYFIDYMRLSGKGINFITRPDFFDKLVGDPELKQQLADGLSEEEIRETWRAELDDYRTMRKRYLIYKE